MIKRKTILILWCIIVLLELVRLTLLNGLIDIDATLTKVHREVQQYKEENDTLRAKILRRESLQGIESEARSKGFVPAPTLLLWEGNR